MLRQSYTSFRQGDLSRAKALQSALTWARGHWPDAKFKFDQLYFTREDFQALG